MAEVKVRIALVIDGKGNWCASGSSYQPDTDSMEVALDMADIPEGGELQHWIVADVPVPSVSEIVGALSPDSED